MNFTIPNISVEVISSVLPKNVLDIRDLNNVFGEDKINNSIKMTGIEKVFISNEFETTADLGIDAANNIFNQLSINREDIDSIVFISQTPDFIMPPTSCIIHGCHPLRAVLFCLNVSANSILSSCRSHKRPKTAAR